MSTDESSQVQWQRVELSAPGLSQPVAVVAAKHIPYQRNGGRFQTMNVYLPTTPASLALIGQPVTSLPSRFPDRQAAQYLVHIHGGAWRDPRLGAESIEATVALAYAAFDASSPIIAIASLNYRLSQFPRHPLDPYDAVEDHHADPSREAVHPTHVSDIYAGLEKLHTLGLEDHSYVLSGHSSGACLAFQAGLQDPFYFGLIDDRIIPRAAAILGLNGLYDLPALVHGLNPSHEDTRGDYTSILSAAFGPGEQTWRAASPAHFDAVQLASRLRAEQAPKLVVIDQSEDDQLVPMNQRDQLAANLQQVEGMRVVLGSRCTGKHAAPWLQGGMLWDSVLDTLDALTVRV